MLKFLKKLFSTNRTCDLFYNDKVEILVDHEEPFVKGTVVEVKAWAKHGKRSRNTVVLVRTIGEVEKSSGFNYQPTRYIPRLHLKLIERSKES